MLEVGFQEVVMRVIVDFADINELEIFEEVLPHDKENPIFLGIPLGVLILQSLLFL